MAHAALARPGPGSAMTADGTRGVCVTSDPASERVEELQLVLGEGPCIDAFTAVLDVGHRAELFQAQGMVVMQLGVSIGEALVRMRAYAYAENRRLEEVAHDVVTRRLRLDGKME